MLKLNDKLATVQISELWTHGDQAVVFSIWRDGCIFFNYTETHQQGKDLLCLACLFILLSCDFPKVFLILYDFSSLTP